MRPYEMMIIVDPDVEEKAVQPTLEKFLQVITKGGGQIDKLDFWGKRRLAYDIQKKSEGYYLVIDMVATPELAQELDRQLGLNESVLRTKLLRRDVK